MRPKGRERAGKLLVITGLWPTPDRPSTGTFVEQRLRGVNATVVGPRSYAGPMPVRYLGLAWRALTVRGAFDGVEAHVLFPTGIIGLLTARMRRLPLVVYAHGSDVRKTAQENWLYRLLASYVARTADAVVTNSNATADLVRDLGATPIVVPPGVDLGRFRPTPRPKERRVLYLGGTRHHKGYDRAIAVADTLAGPGLREIDPADVPALIADHDIVLVPSRAEAFGLVAAEAIASGRWVVAGNVDGLREVVANGVNGTLVDGDGYKEALRSVPDYDPNEVAATAARFSLAEHQERMAAAWSAVVSSRRR
jgi:glycosyltransferase involved in cell wall biosynthesis